MQTDTDGDVSLGFFAITAHDKSDRVSWLNLFVFLWTMEKLLQAFLQTAQLLDYVSVEPSSASFRGNIFFVRHAGNRQRGGASRGVAVLSATIAFGARSPARQQVACI